MQKTLIKFQLMRLRILIIGVVFLYSGCSLFTNPVTTPVTPGDPLNAASYGYTPIDPVPARIDSALTQGNSITRVLTDETIRLAIGSINGFANVTYGKDYVGYRGKRYLVILDYIKYTTIPYTVNVWRDTTRLHIRYLTTGDPTVNPPYDDNNIIFGETSTLPLYIGVGLRITADVTVNTDSLNLELFGLGVAASANRANGTLVVQTLGVSGENISPLLPLPSKLNETTIENAIVSLGTIKAKIYEPATILAPKVLGFYNNIGGVGLELTTNVISSILTQPIIVKTLKKDIGLKAFQ